MQLFNVHALQRIIVEIQKPVEVLFKPKTIHFRPKILSRDPVSPFKGRQRRTCSGALVLLAGVLEGN
jgi:hypothetical protein